MTLALALLIASPAIALAKGEKKPAPCPATQFVNQMTKNLTLTDDQKTKLEGFEKEFGPKMVDAAKAGDVLTPEQKEGTPRGREGRQSCRQEGQGLQASG